MGTPHFLLTPYVPTRDEPFDRLKAVHLLNRAVFGPTDADIERVMGEGPAAAVDRLLGFPDQPAEEQTPDDLPDLSGIAGMPTNFRQYRRMLQTKTEDERKQLLQQFMMANRQALMATGGWWLDRMARGPHPLQEKLALLWHGHFTTSAKDERSALLMWRQNELLRAHAVGDFRAFVKAVSRDPAMLDYLNNTQNHKARPNENYARELMELFTLGIGHYTERDVKEAARAFTGWSHDGDEFAFRPFDHDDGEKTFLGRTGAFGGDDVIDLICSRKRCATYIATRLYRYFVTETVEESLADALGEVLWDARYDLRPLLRTMLTSRGFYRADVVGGQVKSPVQLVVGTTRALGMAMPPAVSMQGPLNQMGQVPFMPPNVKGWPGGRAWINTSTLFARYNFAIRLVELATVEGAASAEAVVDRYVDRLIGRPIDEGKRKLLVDSVGGRPGDEQAVKRMVKLVVSMPEYQVC